MSCNFVSVIRARNDSIKLLNTMRQLTVSYVEVYIIVITVNMLLCFIAVPQSFSQETSELFLEISPTTIEPGGTASTRISTVIESNSTKDVVARFVPPQGSAESIQIKELSLQPDSLGFATATVNYPNDFQPATTTRQPGNYTVIVQDKQTGMLLKRALFEVVVPKNFFQRILESASDFPALVLFPVIAAAIGTFITFLYNKRAASRDKKSTLNQKKAEYLFTLKPHYGWLNNALGMMISTLQYLKPDRVGGSPTMKEAIKKMIVGSNKGNKNAGSNDFSDQVEKMTESIEGEIEERWLIFFHALVLFLREQRKIGIAPGGWWFLNDSKEEELCRTLIDNINLAVMRDKEVGEVFPELLEILPEDKYFDYTKRKIKEKDPKVCSLYEKVKKSIEAWSNTGEIDKFILELRLLMSVMQHQKAILIKDWYNKTKGVKAQINNYEKEINYLIDELAKIDPEYSRFKLN
jgi:hypothetical protein